MRARKKTIRTAAVILLVILLCGVSFLLGSYVMRERIQSDNSSEDISSDINNTTAGEEAKASATPAVTGEEEAKASVTPKVTAAPAETDRIVYSNTQYGFDFMLPKSWEGYSVQTEVWQGTAYEGEHQGEVVEFGITLFLRHPEWTVDSPRQDIPIMIFTLDQWDKVAKEEISVSAAPIIPTKLGSNSKYVFALPARYNYAYLTGYEEVEELIQNNSLVPNENFK